LPVLSRSWDNQSINPFGSPSPRPVGKFKKVNPLPAREQWIRSWILFL
jgi:hypothetical protein